MIISKHVHSCLLVKENGKTIIIDPGNYSYEENALDLEKLEALDHILITHEHPDHMYIPFIKKLIQKFPNVKIITNALAKKVLELEGINALSESNSDIIMANTPHEKVFGITPPENVQFEVFGHLTHPGDSLTFKCEAPVLALPVQAPWGSLTQAVDYAVSQRPKVIIPIHDWHWNEKARDAFYTRLEKYFGDLGIKFLPLRTSEEVNI